MTTQTINTPEQEEKDSTSLNISNTDQHSTDQETKQENKETLCLNNRLKKARIEVLKENQDIVNKIEDLKKRIEDLK